MRANSVVGIVFPNVHDDLMSEMTASRSMGSVPFGGRYRLIDFSLSNLVNAGISKVGVITKNNYQSLMDHLGSGKPWDLDRKNGGLTILPPFSNSDAKIYTGHVDALRGAMKYLKTSTEEYVLLCDADVICNFDLEEMMDEHISKQADVTIAFKKGDLPRNHRDLMSFEIQENMRISEILLSNTIEGNCNFSLDIMIMRRTLLIELVDFASDRNRTSIARDIFQPNADKLKIYGWEVKSFAAVMDSVETYVSVSSSLLGDEKVREELFCSQRPVFTKTRDDMPTKYGLACVVENSIIADGCVIEGTVRDSIISRGAKISKGATVEKSIVMQDCIIRKNADLKQVILDKNVLVGDDVKICGTANYPTYIRKDAIVK